METCTGHFQAIIEGLLREEDCAYERRLRKWSSVLDPRDDLEEFVVSQVVDAAFELELVGRARREARRAQIQCAAEVELQSVHELGMRLFFDRSGPTAMYALRPEDRCVFEKTGNGLAVDPDHPATLVRKLEASGAGCRWLLEQWVALRERLDAGLSWQAQDRLRASRLMGRRVADLVDSRPQAEMYLACFAINPVGYNAWVDLLAEMTKPQWRRYLKRIRSRWNDLITADQTERAMQILVRLTDENIQRLNAKIEEFDARIQEHAERTVNLLGFDQSAGGEAMRRHQMKCKAEFWRAAVDYIRKVRRGGGWRVEGGGWRVTGGGEVGGVADEPERTSEVDNSAVAVGVRSVAGGSPPLPARGGSFPTRGEEELGDKSQRVNLEPEGESQGLDVDFQQMERGGVAAEGGVLAAVGDATEGDKLRDVNLKAQREPAGVAGKGGMPACTSDGGGGDPYRGMSKRDKRKARRVEKEKREAEHRLELAKADMDALLGPSAQAMRELFETSPELAEYMKTNLFK